MKLLVFILIAVTAVAAFRPAPEPQPEPEPEPTCQLHAQSLSECKRIANRNDICTTCVTTSCTKCREVYVKHCQKPTPVRNVEACVRERGAECFKKYHGTSLAKCTNGIRVQCKEHLCEPKPEPEPHPEPEPEPTCELHPETHAECKKIANEDGVCTRCVTSACTKCREVVIKHCVKPTPVRDVASCVAARGKPCRDKFATNAHKLEKCLKGIRVQCGLHVCNKPQPNPEPEPVCHIAPQSEAQCKKIAKSNQFCTACVTSACKACIEVFVKHCVKPTPVRDVASCVAARGKHCRDKFRNNKAKIPICERGIRAQCALHVCNKPQPNPEPEPVCHIDPQSEAQCKKIAKSNEFCTACVTSACKACIEVFVKHCVKPTPVRDVASCVAARGKYCHDKFRTKKHKIPTCERGIRAQCALHVCNNPQPEPEPEPVCELVPQSLAECKKLAKRDEYCTACKTSACTRCREVVIKHCVKPTPVRDVETCVRTRGAVCEKYRKRRTKLNRCLKGIKLQCGHHVCQHTVPTQTTGAVETEPVATPAPTTAAATTAAATTAAGTTAAATTAAPGPSPGKSKPKPVPVCQADIADEDLPQVIYIAAEEEDCTTELKREVNDLQLLVDKLTLLLTVKGVAVGEGDECALPGKSKKSKKGSKATQSKKGSKKGGKKEESKKGSKATKSKKGGKSGKKDGKSGKGGKSKKDGKSGKKGGSKKDGKSGKGGKSKKDGKSGKKGGSKKEGKSKKDGKSGKGSKGKETGSGGEPPVRVSSTGSSAAVNTMLVVGLVIGAAVAAGVAAVAIGLVASGAAASAASPASAANMAAAQANPLYESFTAGGQNALH